MALPTQTFSQLVASGVAAVQGACATLVDMTTGSVLRALIESDVAVALWLQAQVLQVLARTRLATSSGSDVDSWVADFGLTRLGATYATGTVTFTSLNPSGQSATVPVGATVRTADASLTYAVVEDDSNANWSASAGGYIRQAGVASITVPVQCLTAGAAGNVAAGAINLLGTAIAGIDTVTNAAALTNAADAETDAALRARFVLYINSRSLGTLAAIAAAVQGVQTGLLYQIVEDVDPSGAARLGYVTIYADDGSGSPSAALLAEVYAAVDAVRAAGVAIAVVGPTVLPATVALSITTGAGVDHAAACAAVQTAIAAYIDDLTIGAVLSYTRVVNLAYSASSSVQNVSGVTLNGGMTDLGGGIGQAVRVSSVSVS